MKSDRKKIIILTALPFRKQGNQSMIRFVNMFIKREMDVTMFTAGFDDKGENAIESSLFKAFKIKSLGFTLTAFLNKKVLKLRKNKVKSDNYFVKIRSEDIVPPYGSYNLPNLINKWSKYLLYLLDNILLMPYLLLAHFSKIKDSDVVIAYEEGYTLTARLLARLFGKKYINKFQGTILKATNRNISQAIKYFPHNYFTINKSDLCIMVQDGTDGEYYARLRGCRNIFFEPHGVYIYEHTKDYKSIVDELKRKGKFVLFNNASGSTWKRTDRVIRGLANIKKELLENIVLITTYHAANRDDLVEFVKLNNLQDKVIFLDKIDPFESNYIIQKSNVVIMTNDFSNLGNPILEAIYYKTSLISINDGSLDGLVGNGKDCILINLDRDFDRNMALAIERMYSDKAFYKSVKEGLNVNRLVRELSEQQEREFKAIQVLLEQ